MVYRCYMWHTASPGLCADYWKILRDMVKEDRALDYARESAKFWKATTKVVKVRGVKEDTLMTYNVNHPEMLRFETCEGRAREWMFNEYIETNEVESDDLPFVKVTSFAAYLDSTDGKVELYDITKDLRKELH